MKTKQRPKCSVGTYCGDSCISRKVKCRLKLTDQQKAEIRDVVKKFQRERAKKREVPLVKIQRDKLPITRPKEKPGQIVETPDKIVPPLKKVGDKVRIPAEKTGPARPVAEIVKIFRFGRSAATVKYKDELVQADYKSFYAQFPGAPVFKGSIVFRPLGPTTLGSYSAQDNIIRINSERPVREQGRTIHHELAHHVEDNMPKVLAKSIEYLKSGKPVPRSYSRAVYLRLPSGNFVKYMDFDQVPKDQVQHIVSTELFTTLVESKHPGTVPGSTKQSPSLNKLWREYVEIVNENI